MCWKSSWSVDAKRFGQPVREAQHAFPDDPSRARELLGEALALWRGPLADFN
jgi:Bacterial transcriptional activator domain